MNQNEISSKSLQRKAVIYIRQSSPMQVEQHPESRKRQYQLVARAQAMGWPAAACIVIDEDLGLSGAQSYNRPGYQRLVSMIALREVGIILGLEVSRLARNNLDWYQLLELAAAFNVLIADEDGLYDPACFNDRLLLGLKGTISEVELYQIRARLVRGRLSKAKRGELRIGLPVGLAWDPLTDKVRLDPDESVRDALAHLFELFRKLRSVRGMLHHLRERGLEVPAQERRRGLGRRIIWRPPSYDALYNLLKNPAYAGAYVYGKREKQVNPITHTVHVRRRPQKEWEVFIPEHHPGYITWSEFEENQRTLRENGNRMGRGAARRGPALLQGVVFCKHCGHKMRVRYSNGAPYYCCDAAHRRFGEPICQWASARRVDPLVEDLFLTVVGPHTLDLSCSHEVKLQEEERQVNRAWEQRLQRHVYEADLARHRYESVDPENRLVAHTLETEWNEKLVELEAARQAYEAEKPSTYELRSTMEEMQEVISNLRQLWHGPDVAAEDKKELLRCLIENVFLEQHGKVIRAEVTWHGGARSELDVPKYLFSSPQLYHKIRELALTHTDTEIAEELNREGTTTVRGLPWTPRRVMDFRLSNAIASGFTTNAELRALSSGYITSAEAAEQLGVARSTIQKWYRLGVLSGKHDGGQSPLWIAWTPEVCQRLNGGATPDPRMVSIRSLCRQHGKPPDEVLAWAKQNGHGIYRLRRGKTVRFYILPASSPTDRTEPEKQHV